MDQKSNFIAMLFIFRSALLNNAVRQTGVSIPGSRQPMMPPTTRGMHKPSTFDGRFRT